MKTFNKTVSIFLVFVFLLSSVSVLSYAAKPQRLIETDKYVYYIDSFEEKEAHLRRFKDKALGQDGTLTIPNEIDGYKIIYFDSYTFDEFTRDDEVKKFIVSDGVKSYRFTYDSGEYGRGTGGYKNLEEVVIPDNFFMGDGMFSSCPKLSKVTFKGRLSDRISVSCFAKCTSLKEIRIPEGIEYIDESAFEGCKNLKKVNIPATVKSIGERAFADCKSLKKITLPSGLVSIGSGAFWGCKSLEGKMKLPKKLKEVGGGAFAFCYGLTGFRIADGNKHLSQKGGVLFNKKKTKIYCYLSSKETKEYKMPSTVKSVSKYSFVGTKHLKKLTFSDKVKKIPFHIFEKSNIKHLVLSKSVEEVLDIPNRKTLKTLTVKNKNCSLGALGRTGWKSTTIYGYKNSTAQKFAKKAKLKFVAIK